MHALKDGPANRSYGLQVAALAGLPKAVIAEAKRTLADLERGMHEPPATASDPSPQLGLFSAAQPSAAERALDDLDPDTLTPREALDALYRLKALR
jgi:DNA mismatch repair protein MutS